MTGYDFQEARREWGSPPVEGRGYIPSQSVLSKSDADLRSQYETASTERYNSWRGNYADALALDQAHGAVLDYGCGYGTDSLKLAMAGNDIILADINAQNVAAARKIHQAHGFDPQTRDIREQAPFIDNPLQPNRPNVFFSAGVVHHFPYADKVMEWARSAGFDKAILLVYSDRLWRDRTSSEMPGVDESILTHPRREDFARSVDGVGHYAEPYDEARIQHKLAVGGWRLTELIKVGDKDQFYAVHLVADVG